MPNPYSVILAFPVFLLVVVVSTFQFHVVGCYAWVPSAATSRNRLFLKKTVSIVLVPTIATTTTPSPCTTGTSLMMAGFGGGTGSSSNRSKKNTQEVKLKPKQQWDRFTALKKETRYPVAIRKTGDNDASSWLEVGAVRSKDNQYTEASVVRQRGLIVDHARRLFPLAIGSKDSVQWAVRDDDEWKIVDKKILEEITTPGLEKLIGFEGNPDPASGYYCVYNEGRLVNDASEARPSSKQLK